MKLKAQNSIEIITMVALVAVVVVTAFMFMHGNNSNIASLSGINTGKTTPVSLSNKTPLQRPVTTVPTSSKTDIETAGALSSILAYGDKNALANRLATLTLNDVLVVKTQDNETIFELADSLINEYNLPVSPFKGEYAIDDDAKLRLMDIAVKTNDILTQKESTSATFDAYVSLLKQILKI